MTIKGEDAWRNAAGRSNSRWFDDIERFNHAPSRVAHEAKFSIGRTDRFFCLGSCFARNIEEYLIYNDIDVLSKQILSPKNEYSDTVRANALVNKFTTASILNEIRWISDTPEMTARFFLETAKGWIDPQLGPGQLPVSLERAIQRRTYLMADYFPRIARADVIVMTLGLNEVWKDDAQDLYLNIAPGFAATRREAARYVLEETDVAENINALEEICGMIWRLNASARIVVTVSPVPMQETFSGRDVLIANTASKSTLRAAAESIARRHQAVDYFPSFEMVTAGPRAFAYMEDCLHVNDAVVGAVVQAFLRSYLGEDGRAPLFTDRAYLRANPDVELAVRAGQFASGYEHWIIYGRAEGRTVTFDG